MHTQQRVRARHLACTQPISALLSMRRAVQYALRKGVDVIVPSGNENQNLDDPKTDSLSPTNGTAADVIQNRPVDLVSTVGGGDMFEMKGLQFGFCVGHVHDCFHCGTASCLAQHCGLGLVSFVHWCSTRCLLTCPLVCP